MAKFAFVCCGKDKQKAAAQAQYLYISPRFKIALECAKGVASDEKHVFILSAEHHLLSLDQMCEWYDKTLTKMTDKQQHEWAETVLQQLKGVPFSNLKEDIFFFFTDKEYNENLLSHLTHYVTPLTGLLDKESKEKDKLWLKRQLTTHVVCGIIHQWFHGFRRFSFDDIENTASELPKTGVCIFFEKGETAHGEKRIVYVGTHEDGKELQSWLGEKFLAEDKATNGFRQHIKAALLKRNDALDSQCTVIEDQVTQYIRDKISFVVVPEESYDNRKKLVSKIISTVSWCKDCKPSENWLGNFSPEPEIRESGLWTRHNLWREPLSLDDLFNPKDDEVNLKWLQERIVKLYENCKKGSKPGTSADNAKAT